MQEINITAKYQMWICCTCGVPYIIPDYLDDVRRKIGDAMYCCNGHKNVYADAAKLKQREESGEETEQDREIRDLKLKLIHLQEQAEARQADGKEPAPDAAGASDSPAGNPQPIGELPPIKRTPTGRCICPYCDTRPWAVHIHQHLRRHHGVSDEAIAQLKFS